MQRLENVSLWSVDGLPAEHFLDLCCQSFQGTILFSGLIRLTVLYTEMVISWNNCMASCREPFYILPCLYFKLMGCFWTGNIAVGHCGCQVGANTPSGNHMSSMRCTWERLQVRTWMDIGGMQTWACVMRSSSRTALLCLCEVDVRRKVIKKRPDREGVQIFIFVSSWDQKIVNKAHWFCFPLWALKAACKGTKDQGTAAFLSVL